VGKSIQESMMTKPSNNTSKL
jgi:hypothetical protein